MTGRVAHAEEYPAAIELTQPQEYFIAPPHERHAVNSGQNPLLNTPDAAPPIQNSRATLTQGWIHLVLRNRTSEQEWMLDVSNLLIRHLVVHSQSGTRHRISEQGFVKRWPFDLRYGSELVLPTGETSHIWIYLDAPAGFQQPLLSVLPLRDYQHKSSSYSMHLLIVLGALVILAIYQSIIFIPTRDSAYIWSAVTHLCAAFAWAGQCKALMYSIGLDDQDYWLHLPLYLALAALILFSRHYLRLYHPHPLARTLDATALLVLACGATGLLLPTPGYILMLHGLSLPVLILLTATSLLRWRSGMSGMSYQTIALLTMLLGTGFGWLDQILQLHLLENGILAAARLQLLLMILLMVGLIDRTSLVQRERSQQDTRSGTDPLTGLPNRAAFERDVRAWEAYCHEGIFTDFYLSFFDIINLHAINRRKGHREGDRLLILISGWLQSHTDNRHIYRIGGNEFLVLSQRNIEWNLATLEQHLRQEGFRDVQVKIGSSCYSESSCRSSMLKMADERLRQSLHP